MRRISRGLNAFVALLMILQPVSAPGILGAIALADEAPTQTSDAPTDQEAAGSDNTDKADEADKVDDTSNDTTNESEAQSESNESGSVNEPAPTDSNETSTDGSGGSDGTENPPSDSTNNDNSATSAETGDTASPVEENADVSMDNSAPAGENTTSESTGNTDAENAEIINTESNIPENGTISPDAASSEQPTEEEGGKICLAEGSDIVSSDRSDWSVDGDTAETKNKVELGVKYVFPLDSKVSVTFMCLPASGDERTPLKIQQINSSDINLPNDVTAATEYAYDITTGMKNGDFEYDLSLPRGDAEDVQVSYIEKSVSELNSIQPDDVKEISIKWT